jgi:phage baseplate assembly protein W
MDSGQLLGRSISFPPRLGTDGRIAWSSGVDNVRESIQIILLTEPNERVRLPTFGAGLRQFLFEPNTVTTRHLIAERIRQTLDQWEPRINLQSVEVEADPDDPQGAIATIIYRLVATQATERLSLNVQLAG